MLLTTYRNEFFSFISPRHLYAGALFFGVITLAIVVAVFVFLHLKRRRFFRKQRIEAILYEWISEAIVQPEAIHVHVTPELLDYFKYSEYRQFATDLLMNTKKNLIGTAKQNLIQLYEQLNLQYDAADKLRSTRWHQKAKGIYELYMMEQARWKEEIRAYTNHRNERVRYEAQTAALSFDGFAGLSFLEHLTETLDEWQQLVLLEQLKPLDAMEMPRLGFWIRSSNDSVSLFALKLADIYRQYAQHDAVAGSLRHTDERLRAQAIITLGSIANDGTTALLRDCYACETSKNKLLILHVLGRNGQETDTGFLEAQLHDEDMDIKLQAAAALFRLGKQAILRRMAETDELFHNVLKHVAQEIR